MIRERWRLLVESIWRQLRHLFDHDDGSQPDIELVNLAPAAIPRVLEILLRHGQDFKPGAYYWDRRDEEEQPISSIEDAVNAAVLVCNREVDSFYLVLKGLECAGSSIPDLGVFVYADGLTLDYQMGSEWGPWQVAGLFELFLAIAEVEPGLAVHDPYAEVFAAAWERYREARSGS